MIDDIVKELRKGTMFDSDSMLMDMAADEIARKNAALRAKDNIAYIIDSHGMTHQCFTIVYRAALAGEKTDA